MDMRTPYEIKKSIEELSKELVSLKKELEFSEEVYENHYNEYIGKWIYCNAHEEGFSYIYVLGIDDFDEDLTFRGYGVDYDFQDRSLRIVTKEFPQSFYIGNHEVEEINPEKVIKDICEFLRIELTIELFQ